MKNANRLLGLLLAALMLLTLTACGDKEPADPNLVKVGDYTVLYKGASIMTDDEGNDAVVLTLDYTNNSKEDAAFWAVIFEKAMQDGIALDTALVYPDPDSYVSVTDDKFTAVAPGKTFELHTAFVLRDMTTPIEMKFSDLFEKKGGTITIDPATLTRKETQPKAPTSQTGEPTTAASTGDALLDWWNGNWYGWWTVSGGDGEYESWNNKWWDCCANINIGADYTGSVILWDESLPKDDAVSEAAVTLSSAGTGEYGTLTSESGYFLDEALAHADWIVDPGLMNYADLICIDGWYEDENGSFKYACYLRPWGTIWDDVAADSPEDLPYYYESWYLPLVKAGEAMPDTLGGGEVPTTGGQNEATNPAGTNEGNGNGEAADGEYGKSNADATGIAKLEDMQALYKICFESRTDGYHVFTYEEARDMLGCDGIVWKKASFTWNETKHTYRWETEDGKDYFNISFVLEDGEEWYDSCNMSENVINGLW